MDAKTLEALKASIAKWERNAEAKTPAEYKITSDDCPLCKLFRDLIEEGDTDLEQTGMRLERIAARIRAYTGEGE